MTDLTAEMKQSESFISWFLIAALAGDEITENHMAYPRIVTMQLNGEELDVKQALNRLESEHRRQIKETAHQLLQERCDALLEPLSEQIDLVKDHLNQTISKLNIEED